MANDELGTDPFQRLKNFLILVTEGFVGGFNAVVIALLLFFLGLIALLMLIFGRQ